MHGLLYLVGHGLGILVLPEAQHRPPGLLEVGGGLAVALDVAGDLVGPVLGVGGRLGVVVGASVPVAAINEHRDSALSQHQIGVRGNSGWGRVETLKRMPRLCTAERTANSGFVSRLRLPCIDLRVPSDDAQDPLPEPPATLRADTGRHSLTRLESSS